MCTNLHIIKRKTIKRSTEILLQKVSGLNRLCYSAQTKFMTFFLLEKKLSSLWIYTKLIRTVQYIYRVSIRCCKYALIILTENHLALYKFCK